MESNINKRTTRGLRISVLTGDEAKFDDEFYNNDIWKEESSEDESYEGEEIAPDEFDSDFNDSEDDEEENSLDEDDNNRKRKSTDKPKNSKYKEPVITKVKIKASNDNSNDSQSPIAKKQRHISSNVIDMTPRQVRESTKIKTKDADTARLLAESCRIRIKHRPPIKYQFDQDELLREALDTEIESQVWLDSQKLATADDSTIDKPTKALQLATNYIRYHSRKGSYNTITFPTTESMPDFLRDPNRHIIDHISRPTLSDTERVGTHRGQVSFPGGHIEANESVIDAAIRETNEELGNNIGNVKVLGICQTIPAITGTLVTPVLGFVENDILDFERLNPNADEVSRIFTRSIDTLLSRDYRIIEKLSRNGEFAEMPAFGTGDEKIWGLTAVILDSVLTNLVIPNYNNNNLH
eukprot:gene18602-24331_t